MMRRNIPRPFFMGQRAEHPSRKKQARKEHHGK